MKKLLGIVVLSLLMTGNAFAQKYLSVIDQMYDDCLVYSKFKKIGSNISATNEEYLALSICGGYFQALDYGIMYQGIWSNLKIPKKDKIKFNTENVLGSCIRDPKYNIGPATLKDIMIKAFTRYVEDNPKIVKQISNQGYFEIIQVLGKALREKYPCKK